MHVRVHDAGEEVHSAYVHDGFGFRASARAYLRDFSAAYADVGLAHAVGRDRPAILQYQIEHDGPAFPVRYLTPAIAAISAILIGTLKAICWK